MGVALGSALKPSHEPVVVARKPLSGTLAATVAEYGTGAMNIDGCRIGSQERPVMVRTGTIVAANAMSGESTGATSNGETTTLGRWPPNAMFVHADGCRRVGERRVKAGAWGATQHTELGNGGTMGTGWTNTPSRDPGVADADGMETVEAWDCVDGCVVAELDRQSGDVKGAISNGRRAGNGAMFDPGEQAQAASYGDSGGASRFFLTAQGQPEPRFRYEAKASAQERHAGLGSLDAAGEVIEGGRRNVHPLEPTVKPVKIMQWLVRLVTPPGGLVLDPFAGSGTTGCAAALEGVRFVGIEKDPTYAAIAEARIAWWRAHPDGVEIVERLASERQQARVRDSGQDALF